MTRARVTGRMLIAALAIIGMMLVSSSAPAVATSHYARITIHKAVCDSQTGDLFGQCHEDRVSGAWFYVAGVWRPTNANGVVTWAPGAGTRALYEDVDQFNQYEGAYVYCSNQVTGKVLWDGPARANGSVTITTTAGQPVVCDWYNLT
jgi:hypothetical protein